MLDMGHLNPTPIPMSHRSLRRFSNSWDLSSNRHEPGPNHCHRRAERPSETDFTARTPGLRWRNDLRSCLVEQYLSPACR